MHDEAAQSIWVLSGRDDRGTDYLSGGGAYGLSADGTHTRGDHALTPPQPTDASWMDIIFYNDKDPWETPTYVLRVDLHR